MVRSQPQGSEALALEIQEKLEDAFQKFLERHAEELNDPAFLKSSGQRALLQPRETEVVAEVELVGFSYMLVKRPRVPRTTLTAREKEIALLVAEGLINKEIATRLGISRFTVASHIRKIYRKLNVNSRIALAMQAIELN